ncbi:BatA domain-containing protein [Bacteroidota bacterium]
MHFLYPGFLFALFLIGLPILIHFFTLRKYRTVYFSNISWLKNVKKEDRSKSKLRQILILIIRIMIISALVFAFSQPYISKSSTSPVKGRQIVCLYIDNSFSMESMTGDNNLLEIAKTYAVEIVNSLRPDTRYYLITNNFDQKLQHFINKKQTLEKIAGIDFGPNRRTISQITSRCANFLKSDYPDAVNISENSYIYILSDFQENITDLEQIETEISIRFLPIQNDNSKNIFIDSVWFETPKHNIKQQETVFASIRNISDEPYRDIPVRLFINDSLKALNSININGKSTQNIQLSYSNSNSGVIHGKIELDDYPVTYDNSYYFSYTVREKIKVLIINEDNINSYLSAVFEIDNYFDLTDFNSGKIASYNFSEYNLIILNSLQKISSGLAQEINDYILAGGSMLIFPANNINIESYNFLLNKIGTNYITGYSEDQCEIEFLDYEHELYKNTFREEDKNVDFPVFKKYYLFSDYTNRPDHLLLKNEKNEKLLSVSNYGAGKAYVFSISLNNNDLEFVKHPVFFPTVYNIALSSFYDSKISYIIGKEARINLPSINSTADIHLINNILNFDFIPQRQNSNISGKKEIYIGTEVNYASNYSVVIDQKEYSGLSFNYNRLESVLEYISPDELEEIADNIINSKIELIKSRNSGLSKSLDILNHGKQLWKLFILIALGLLAIEIILLRFWR